MSAIEKPVPADVEAAPEWAVKCVRELLAVLALPMGGKVEDQYLAIVTRHANAERERATRDGSTQMDLKWQERSRGQDRAITAATERAVKAEAESRELRSELEAALRAAAITGWIANVLDGKEVSELAKSVSVVAQVLSLRSRLAEVEKERDAWSARCLTAEQDLAIAGVRGSPPLGGQEPTIPRLRRERDAAQARARKLEAALREYHPEPHDSPPRPNCPACKLLTPPALPPSDDTSYDAVALPQVPPALPLCSRCGKPNVDRGRIADTVIYGCDCTTYQRFEPRAAHEPPAGGEPKP